MHLPKQLHGQPEVIKQPDEEHKEQQAVFDRIIKFAQLC